MSVTEESIALLRTDSPDRPRPFESLRRRLRRIWMAAIADPERGPADYDEREDTLRLLISIIRKQTDGAGGGNYNEAPKESNTKAVIIGCTITLLCAFIIGSVVFSNEFSALKAQVTEWQKSTDRRIDALERRP